MLIIFRHPPIQWAPAAPTLEVKRPRREADHSPPSSAKINKGWSCTSIPQYVFMTWYLIKQEVRLYGVVLS
jgi:hypothetical protein